MAPTSMMATISNEVATGRSMKIRDGFMSRPELLVGLGGPACPCALASGAGSFGATAIGLTSSLLLLGVRRRRRNGRALRSTRSAAARPADLGAVAQTVGAVDHDLVADLQAAGDLNPVAIGHAKLDDADLHRIVGFHEIDEGTRRPAL